MSHPLVEDSCRDLINILEDPRISSRLTLRQWDRLLSIAREKNLLSRLAHSLSAQRLAGNIPDRVEAHLLSAQNLATHQHQGVIWETRHIADALAPLGIPVVLLKGAAYVLSELPAAKGRLFGDIDILVPKNTLNAVEAALMKHGWTSTGIDPYDQRYYRKWMHELPPMTHRIRATSIDVHHNILPETAKYNLNICTLLQSATQLPGSGFYVLSPCDLVIHSATHLFHDGDFHNGLRDLHDLSLLINHFAIEQENYWHRLQARAMEIGLEKPVFFAVRYARILLRLSCPAKIENELQRAAKVGALRLHILDRAFLSVIGGTSQTGGQSLRNMAALLLYIRAHMLRMPPLLLAQHLVRKAILRSFKNTSRTT